MDKRLRLIAALLGLLPLALVKGAPEPPPPPPQDAGGAPDARPDSKDRRGGDDRRGERRDGGPEYPGRFKDKLEKMSPEERQHFEENWERWKKMGEREREEWKRRADEARKRVEKAIDDTLAKLDLKLDQDRREAFALRYRQERKNIEKQICEKMDQERKVMIDAMLQRLKVEFASPAPNVSGETKAESESAETQPAD